MNQRDTKQGEGANREVRFLSIKKKAVKIRAIKDDRLFFKIFDDMFSDE